LLAQGCLLALACGASVRPVGPAKDAAELDLDDEAWRALIEGLPLVTYILTPDGELLYVSPQIEAMLGLKREHWLTAGTDWLAGSIHPADLRLAWPASRRGSSAPGLREYRLVAADGRALWVVDERMPVQSSGGAEYVQGYLLDVTERKETAAALRASEEKFRSLISTVPGTIYRSSWPDQGVIDFISQQVEELTGHTPDEFLMKNVSLKELVHSDDREMIERAIANAVQAHEQYSVNFRLLHTDGDYRWVHESGQGVYDAEGQALWRDATILDLSEHRRIEEALARERQLMNTLLETTTDQVYFKDRASRFIKISVAQAEKFGLESTEEAIGKTDFDFFSEEHARPAYEDEQRIIRTGEPLVDIEEKETWEDGREAWVSTTKMPLHDDEGNIIGTYGISRDITKRKRAEEAYAKERQLMNTLLETTTDQVYFKDRASRFIKISAAQAKKFGLESTEQAIGRTDFDFFSEEHARPAYEDELRIILTGEPLVDIEEKETWEDGREAWVSTTKMPLRDDQGNIIGTYGISRDITKRKRAEAAVQEDQERMEAVIATQRDVAMSELDLETILQLVVARTQELTRADGAAVLLVDGDDLVVRAACGIASSQVGMHIPVASGIYSKWLAEGVPQRSDDLRADSDLAESVERRLIERGGARSLVGVPLQHAQETVGLLQVVAKRTHSFAQRDVDSLRLLAVVISAALSHAAEYQAKREQVEALAQFEAMYKDAAIGILMVELDGTIIDGNPAITEMLGYSSQELVGQAVDALVYKEDRATASLRFGAIMSGKSDDRKLELRYRHKNGELVWGSLAVSVVRSEEGEVQFGIYMIENVTERKNAEEELRRHAEQSEYNALHDALTGLPNRTLFCDRVEQALLTAEREGDRIALLILDLDRFKEINDTLGHAAGDDVLREVGGRLESCLRASDTVARLGGDEFGLLLQKQKGPSRIVPLLEKLQIAIEAPIEIDGLPLGIEGSVGVAFYPDDGMEVEELMRHADVAMYTAKEDHRGYSFYERTADTHDLVQLTLVGELRRAIDQGELVLHYQPKASFSEGTVDGVEALVRWNHPQRGLLAPDQFIPSALETGLMKPLTLYVLDEALRQVRAWHDEGLDLSVSVNVGRRNMLDLSFPDDVAAALKARKADPSWLELEITESTILDDSFRSRAVFERLNEMGVKLSIDDFGTGYSSLAYLRDLPVSEIKIDRSFVLNMMTRADDEMIVRSTIDLGRNLGLQVVAEGVETEETWNRLAELGCDVAQGYLLTRPVPPEELTDWLALRQGGERRPRRRRGKRR
jgi:diguanylate cyclase (GGDEF)-like protein/PAS domain S-box-containing protein